MTDVNTNPKHGVDDPVPYELKSEFAFRIRLDFPPNRVRFGPMPNGMNGGYVPIVSGTVTGPRLQGKIVPFSGGDWPNIWPQGTLEFDARYLIEAADGTMIYVQNRGIAHSSPEVRARAEAGESVGPDENYFRTTPTFRVATGPHDWLNRTIFVAIGHKRSDHSLFDFYAVC